MASNLNANEHSTNTHTLINTVPGIEYESQFSDPHLFAENRWDVISDIAMQLPIAILPIQSTHPITWVVLGLIRIPVMLIVAFTIQWWVGLIAIIMSHLTESWNDMQARR